MNRNHVEIGKIYGCLAVGVTESLKGMVTSKLDNCAILSVEEYQPCDEETISEKIKMVVARYDDLEELFA